MTYLEWKIHIFRRPMFIFHTENNKKLIFIFKWKLFVRLKYNYANQLYFFINDTYAYLKMRQTCRALFNMYNRYVSKLYFGHNWLNLLTVNNNRMHMFIIQNSRFASNETEIMNRTRIELNLIFICSRVNFRRTLLMWNYRSTR